MVDTILMHEELMEKKAFSNKSFPVSDLIQTHIAMKPVIHHKAPLKQVDVKALTYTFFRLPRRMFSFDLVYLYSSRTQMKKRVDLSGLTPIHNPARRTLVYGKGKNLYVVMRSLSDMYDFLSLLSIYQIEINKLKSIVKKKGLHQDSQLKQALSLFEEDFTELSKILTPSLLSYIFDESKSEKDFRVHVYYEPEQMKATMKRWGTGLASALKKLHYSQKRVYLVSSNTHSLANLIGGYALKIEDELIDFTYLNLPPELQLEVAKVQRKLKRANYQNLLYYLLKKYIQFHPHVALEKKRYEERHGIITVHDHTSAHIPVQIIDLSKITLANLDPRLKKIVKPIKDVIIINYDYPFGMQSSYIFENLYKVLKKQIKGFYITGKAGSLVGNVGDIMIPNAFFDKTLNQKFTIQNQMKEQEGRWSLFSQIIRGINGASTTGTLFLNNNYFTFLNEHNIHLVEMEGVPYLREICASQGIDHTTTTDIDLTSLPFALGMIYYVSDTPYRKGRTLSENMSYAGVDATYGVSLSILDAIFKLEK